MKPYYEHAGITIYHGDCREILPQLPMVDLVLADPPYGATQNDWDVELGLRDFWGLIRRICRDTVAFTAQQPFSSRMVLSNIAELSHEWIWDRVNKITNFLNAKHQPMRQHESVLVFQGDRYTYNPQKQSRPPYTTRRTKPLCSSNYGPAKQIDSGRVINDQFPSSIIEVEGCVTTDSLHPTEKPVPLFSFLCATYSDIGQTILDPFLGSGTTLRAAKDLGRKAIGIEIEEKYCEIAARRMSQEVFAL